MRNERLIQGKPIIAENSPVYQNQAVTIEAPEAAFDAVETGFTGEKKTIDRASGNYGGGQFVMKLFTEGLSRCASGTEYMEFYNIVIEEGCNTETLKKVAKMVFDSELFKSFELTDQEITYSVYRAILSREPKDAERGSVNMENLMQVIDQLIDSEEFAELLPEIGWGPYYWYENNHQQYTGDVVLTTEEFNQMVADASDTKVVVLPQGALILVDQAIHIPSGYVVKTEGNPEHYAKFAKFMRIHTQNSIPQFHVLTLGEGVTLQNIFCDGNRTGAGAGHGWNIVCGQDGCVVWGCRSSDSSSNVHLYSVQGSHNQYFGYNLVTCYATSHHENWADGIDILSGNSICEYNHITDATDGGLVVFRALKNGKYTQQNSIVRYNQVSNTGNCAYAGFDNESVERDGKTADFTGFVAYGNAFFTSYTAHMHLFITMSSSPWTNEFNRIANNSFYNNYTPEGCFVMTAAGIVVDKTTESVVRGNQFHIYLGDWTTTNFGLGKRLYSVNGSNVEGGAFQDGYVDMFASADGMAFISSTLPIEKHEILKVEEAYIYEETKSIHSSVFDWLLD